MRRKTAAGPAKPVRSGPVPAVGERFRPVVIGHRELQPDRRPDTADREPGAPGS